MNDLSVIESLADIQSAPSAWSKFRSHLPHQSGDMKKRNWGHPWHSLCSYQGKLKPAIASTLVDALLPSGGGRVLDPFSGVGTIPFEARLKGNTAFGFDINPAAIAISRAKIEPVKIVDVQAELDSLECWLNEGVVDQASCNVEGIRFNGPLESYFHEKTFSEILKARVFFAERGFDRPESAFVLGCLLHVLHGNRPYALSRNSHPITPFAPTGAVVYKSLIEKLRGKVERALRDMVLEPNAGCMYEQDATAKWPDAVDNLDAIITSPPFFDSTRFYSANWMRLWFAGWNAEDFSSRPSEFVEVRQKLDFSVYDSIFAQAVERLKSGGYFALHLGKSSKCDMAEMLASLGRQYLSFVDQFSECVGHCESHGIRDKGTVTEHQYLLFRKV